MGTKQLPAAVPAAADKPKRKPPAAGMGRVAGVPNKTTRALKEAILLAAEQVGRDGRGKDGLVGYLRRVASTDLRAFSGLLAKVLPLQVTGADGRTLAQELAAMPPDAPAGEGDA